MYTDGRVIYDKNNKAMPNGTGLMGNKMSSQSAIFIPVYGKSNLYLLFTTDAHSNGKGKGIRYSIIDMSLAGNGSRKAPKGNVTKSKNKSLVSGTSNTERMTAVCHSNGRDYWLVTQIAPYGEIHSYLISGKTVSVKPVISKTLQLLEDLAISRDK